MLRMIFSIGGRSNAGAAAVSSSGASTSAAGHVRVPRTSTAAPARAWREEDTGLPASQIESARRALDFALWDSELDFDESALPCQELYKLLRAVGVNPMEEYVNEALAAIEVRQSVDTITFGQFVHLWSYLSKGKEDEEKILSDAFNFFDRDGSGAISLEEFKAVTMELADPLSQEEVNAFIALMDENDDAERARLREALKLEDSLSAGNGELSKALEIARIVQTSPRPRTTSLAQNTFGTEPSTSAPASGGQAYHKQDRKVRAGAALGGQDNDDERVAAPATHAMQGSEASSSGMALVPVLTVDSKQKPVIKALALIQKTPELMLCNTRGRQHGNGS
eukprot:jgi/Chlat1/994/Chrsp108S01439